MRFALILGLLLTLAAPAQAVTPADWIAARNVGRAFDEGRGREQLGLALDSLLRTAARVLREHGHDSEAAQIESDWQGLRPCAMGIALCDLGDHDPLSTWLALVYDVLEEKLGVTLCEFFHFSDIKVINFGVPVVFHPSADEKWCVETLAQNPTDSCEAEYGRHFAGTRWQKVVDPGAKYMHEGLIPVIAYWISWGACEAATWGTGWFLVCTPIGDGVEFVTERWIAPPLSDRIYERENPVQAN